MAMMVDVSERINNMRAKPRSCYHKDGSTPKQSYRTKSAAKAAIPKGMKVRAYACEVHGWHLGHPRF